MKIRFLPVLAALFWQPAYAQMVVQAASSILQPQVRRDADGFAQCGVRAIVIDLKPDSADAYDFSISMRLGLKVGMVKAGKANTSKALLAQGKQNTKGVLPGPVNFWLAKEEEGKPMLPLKTFPADEDGYLVEGVDFGQAWTNMFAMANGERMQFALRYKDQPVDTVVSFSGTLTDEELKPLLACFSGLAKRMQDGIKDDKRTKK